MTVGDGVSLVHGLDNAMYGELLEFPNGVFGMVLNLEKDYVGAILFDDSSKVKEKDQVKLDQLIISIHIFIHKSKFIWVLNKLFN